MYKVILAGSRDYTNYAQLCAFADQVLAGTEDIEIVCGKPADDRLWRKFHRMVSQPKQAISPVGSRAD